MLQFKDKRLVKFGEHVRNVREGLGLTPAEVALRSTLTQRDLLSIEEGNKSFAFTTFLELCKGLDVQPTDLLKLEF